MSVRERLNVIVVVETVIVVASCLIGAGGGGATTPSVRPVARTQIKWLINTGHLAGRWPPAAAASAAAGTNDDGDGDDDDSSSIDGDIDDGKSDNGPNGTSSRCRPPAAAAAVASPNTVSRLQMIHGGDTAVLVMPTGDGAHRCCADGVTPQFSLGSVRLNHGRNNLYPVIRPFPDRRAFVDADGDGDDGPPEQRSAADGDAAPAANATTADRGRSETARGDDRDAEPEQRSRGDRRRKIFNAVDAFLDDRGRILWVLDTGIAGVDACRGNKPPVEKRSTDDEDEDPPPKFLAIDVQTNQILSVVSMSRVWKPGVSCFQYIVAIYPDAEKHEEGHSNVNETVSKDTNSTGTCMDWPLVVVGDAGTNHVLVYLHSQDKFTEIMLPADDENSFYNDDDGNSLYGSDNKGDACGDGETKETPLPRKKWPTPPIRDILYVVPLYPHMGHSRLLITYHGCQDVFSLRLHPSSVDFSYYDDANNTSTNDTVVTPAPPAPVTGTLTILGRKPCRMVILGTDRRRTDFHSGNDEGFSGGGTTVYFRLENTNDIWSWNTADKRKFSGVSILYIDERDFRLVRVGRTCRVPVAVSAGPVVAAPENNDDDNDDSKRSNTIKSSIKTQQVVRQLIWMLETNFVDHFAGTADMMGANAKLQPIEEPLYDTGYNDATVSESGDPMYRPPPLLVQPDIDDQLNATVSSPTRSFKREKIVE